VRFPTLAADDEEGRIFRASQSPRPDQRRDRRSRGRESKNSRSFPTREIRSSTCCRRPLSARIFLQGSASIFVADSARAIRWASFEKGHRTFDTCDRASFRSTLRASLAKDGGWNVSEYRTFTNSIPTGDPFGGFAGETSSEHARGRIVITASPWMRARSRRFPRVLQLSPRSLSPLHAPSAPLATLPPCARDRRRYGLRQTNCLRSP